MSKLKSQISIMTNTIFQKQCKSHLQSSNRFKLFAFLALINGANTSKLTSVNLTLHDSFKYSPHIKVASERETATNACTTNSTPCLFIMSLVNPDRISKCLHYQVDAKLND